MKSVAGAPLARRLEDLYRFERSAMRPGVEGAERLLDLGGRPDRSFASVLIAGTNGKGSTAAHLASIFRAAGLKTGLYTSPHLIRFNERIRVDGRELAEDALEALLERWWPRFEAERPSFFEASTALCFDHFAAEAVDMAVVEVGLGGRLDSTNVLLPRVSVITTISIDHTEILGNTLAEIAVEKAGIVKPGGRLALGVGAGAARKAIMNVARERGAEVSLLGRAARFAPTSLGEEGTEFRLKTRRFDGALRTPLLGVHQARNAALAALVADLALPDRTPAELADAIRSGLAGTRWPGRAELVPGDPPILLDVAHNVEGAKAIAETVTALFGKRPVVVVAGFSRDKAHRSILAALARIASRFVLTEFTGERVTPAETLPQQSPPHPAEREAIPDLARALEGARTWAQASGAAVLVTGSFYLVGEALPLLGRDVSRAL